MTALLLLALIVVFVVLCDVDSMEYMGGWLDARFRWSSAVSCNVRVDFYLVLRKCKLLRRLRRSGGQRPLVDTRFLNCRFVARFSRLILLTTFASPAIEAVATIACVLETDALNEFSIFNGRDVAS
ncbi:hypothetical protein DEU56DRAFT_548019 [Suillus clintonianus]|uniref:uncharacterized protein n=1 Tax=Suillus clintonianus TaxID=1904413 RepID=UPI001B868482|nr:uncharacterized protein DEU56DRAFT_548019 [Suillus clintonianus]KAG2151363.1 hypothetical protein DEU56DRAFT_548019 [Suillus clintonianus]